MAEFVVAFAVFRGGGTIASKSLLTTIFVLLFYVLALAVGPIWYFKQSSSGLLEGCVAGALCLIGANVLFAVEQGVAGVVIRPVGDVSSSVLLVAAFAGYGWLRARPAYKKHQSWNEDT